MSTSLNLTPEQANVLRSVLVDWAEVTSHHVSAFTKADSVVFQTVLGIVDSLAEADDLALAPEQAQALRIALLGWVGAYDGLSDEELTDEDNLIIRIANEVYKRLLAV